MVVRPTRESRLLKRFETPYFGRGGACFGVKPYHLDQPLLTCCKTPLRATTVFYTRAAGLACMRHVVRIIGAKVGDNGRPGKRLSGSLRIVFVARTFAIQRPDSGGDERQAVVHTAINTFQTFVQYTYVATSRRCGHNGFAVVSVQALPLSCGN